MKPMKRTDQPQATKLLGNGSRRKPTADEVAVFAYTIWENEGRAHGHALDHWLQAELQLEITLNQEAITA